MRLEADLSSAVQRLAGELRLEAGTMLDEWATAALLEAKGLRDADVQENFNLGSLFEFAALVYIEAIAEPAARAEKRTEPETGRFKRLLRNLWQGSFFAMPMLGQMACVLLARYSLWASLEFTELQATVIGLGTVASFSLTGGLVICIGRQGTFYKGLKAYHLLRAACIRLVAVGGLLSCLIAVGACLMQLLTPTLPFGSFMVALIYYLALSALWLSLGLLYMLGKHQQSFWTTLVGGLIVALLVRGVGVPVYVAQIAIICACAAVAYRVAFFTLEALQQDSDERYRFSKLPPADALVGILLPFFVYGSVYFTLLFADRALAWTAPGRPMPAAVWFHTPYELGMDWGLLSLLLPMAYLEHVVNEFGPCLQQGQQRTDCDQAAVHRRSFGLFAVRSLVVLFVLSVFSVVGSYFGVLALQAFDDVQAVRDFFASPITFTVYWFGAIAYQLLTMGLTVGLMLFTLGRQGPVVTQMAKAFATSVVFGFVASRVVEPHFAVVGFLAGSLVFWAMMLRACGRLSRCVDHFYYSAF